MPAKPTVLPRWANVGGAVVTTPSSGAMDAGYVAAQSPDAGEMNFLFLNNYLWTQWLQAFESTAHTWTAAQTFSSLSVGALAVTGDLTHGGTGTGKSAYFLGAANFFFVEQNAQFTGPVSFTGASTYAAATTFNFTSTFTAGLTANGATVGSLVATNETVSGLLTLSASNPISFTGASPVKTTALLNSANALSQCKASATIVLNGTATPTYSDGHNFASFSQSLGTGVVGTAGMITCVFAQPMADTNYRVLVNNGNEYLWCAAQFVKTTAQVTFMITRISDGANPTLGLSSGQKWDVLVFGRQ